MDTNRIKNVALGARTALMSSTGMALDRVLAQDSPERLVYPNVISQLETIATTDRDGLVERVAYTWFNRLCALRYMDVRSYTPVGIVSPRDGETMPAILADARRGIYAPGLDFPQGIRDMVAKVLSGEVQTNDPLGKAYVMLLTSACQMYEKSMGYLFGQGHDTAGAIELLAPTDLLSEGSVLKRICADLDEAVCNEGVEVMGWLYQFYVSERKDAFFASKKKATAADIAPATQLFTPNWIVRYLVENSLGRLWMLNFPDSDLKDYMDYYVEPEETEEDFLEIYSPEDITFLDPACGSGHILVYAFDLLYHMYEEEGYRPADIPELILKNNLTGIEIDDRAAEIASFCLEMKALERDAGFLAKDVDANVVVTNRFKPNDEEKDLIPSLLLDRSTTEALEHLDEIGSLYLPTEQVEQRITSELRNTNDNKSLSAEIVRKQLKRLLRIVQTLSNQYSIVVTNPPYMSNGGMNAWLLKWVKKNYPNEKSDLCTCFINRAKRFTLDTGYSALITMQSWMFLSSYEDLRHKIIHQNTIVTMAHLGPRAFEAIAGEVVQTTATIFYSGKSSRHGDYFRLIDYPSSQSKEKALKDSLRQAGNGDRYKAGTDTLTALPAWPIAYWISDAMICSFRNPPLERYADARRTLQTGNANRFMREWHEVSANSTYFGHDRKDVAVLSGNKWYPMNYGGEFRKWYGNLHLVVNWENDGREIKATGKAIIPSESSYFERCLAWSKISSDSIAFRLYDAGLIPGDASACLFNIHIDDRTLLGYLNSSVAQSFLNVLNPTLNYPTGTVAQLPVIIPDSTDEQHSKGIVEECVDIARTDWNSRETSWDFTWHPLVPSHYEWVDQHTYNMNATERRAVVELIETRYQRWERDCQNRYDQLKANEEELNRIFARIYGMECEVPIEVPDHKVTVRLADLGCDIRSLVSYGIGCMFGRYSLDQPGLILADEGSTLDDYHAKIPNPTFEPDRTGIIPITEYEDAIFEDDIVSQFRRWLSAAYGESTLDENFAFIEKALGKSLRAYFARDFYNDHVKTYLKRPIYWLFSSPKRGFQALVYLHRYTPQTVSTLLAEYVRPMRDNLGTQARLKEVTGRAKDVSMAAKYDATVAELDAWEHDVIFPLAQKHVSLDLDDGVKANYGKPEFKGALRRIPGLN